MRIAVIDPDSNVLSKVIGLANKNSRTLGFFPEGAFEQKAKEGKILCAIDFDRLYGYLLFDYNFSKQLAYVVHLCVDRDHRKKGIARKLLLKFERMLQGKVGGIRVRCRTDYDAIDIWPKLGFDYIQTIQGRSKRGSRLAIWRKDLPYPDLFKPIIDSTKGVVSACFDLNIFSDYIEAPSDSTYGSHAVMQDWLTEMVEFYVSPELSIELKRYNNEQKKRRIRDLARSFNVIKVPRQRLNEMRRPIGHLFNNTLQDQSDLNHLAWCNAANIDYFVTSDERLRNKNPQIYEITGVKIIHPAYLVLHTDILLRGVEYQPQRFGDTAILIRRLKVNDLEQIVSTFAHDAHEGKRRFVAKLRTLLSQPLEITTELISHNGILLGIVSYQNTSNDELIVNLVRLAPNTLEDTLSVGIVKWLIEKSLSKGIPRLCIGDAPISVAITIACIKFGFYKEDSNLIRLTQSGCLDLAKIRARMDQYEKLNILPAKYCKRVRSDIDRAKSSVDNSSLLNIEKQLWPIKITELNLPTYVVSIKPKYAMHLFDMRISAEDLLGGDSKLLLNIENSYYRSMRGGIEAPGRILWYVCKGERHYQGSQAIRAVSYLNEVHIGKPKELFDRFQYLGIYKWTDILGTVQGDCEKQLMAFVFSHTEVLINPISRNSLNQIWQREKGKNFHIQAPLVISDNLFWKVYNLGMGLSDEKNNKG